MKMALGLATCSGLTSERKWTEKGSSGQLVVSCFEGSTLAIRQRAEKAGLTQEGSIVEPTLELHPPSGHPKLKTIQTQAGKVTFKVEVSSSSCGRGLGIYTPGEMLKTNAHYSQLCLGSAPFSWFASWTGGRGQQNSGRGHSDSVPWGDVS